MKELGKKKVRESVRAALLRAVPAARGGVQWRTVTRSGAQWAGRAVGAQGAQWARSERKNYREEEHARRRAPFMGK